MKEYYDQVQKGFSILLTSMAGYIGQKLHKKYGSNWWDEVLLSLTGQFNLPQTGSYAELVDSLDVANCLRLIDRRWNPDLKDDLSMSVRTYAKELMGVRNVVAHIGMQDLDGRVAERALDTMNLLCKEIDPESASEIETIYQAVRDKNTGSSLQPVTVVYGGIEQPESASSKGALKEGSLLQLVGTEYVQKTTLTRKVTFAGKTEIYPVYKVRLDYLYYNDQNDRIATWISQYESENGEDTLSGLSTDIYNAVIENFICESNMEAIQKTQKNISLVGQREPGVTLADGRIVDGNRRYTCLRRIEREEEEPQYFETVIMDVDIQADKKQIKLLELAIQHGEEKKVDYDLIDFAVGTYRDVVQTKLLTIEEYAESTNEQLADVKKRIDIAEVICEFLEYIRLPEQFFVAREYQLYSLFLEMMPCLKKLEGDEQAQLKKIAFNNVLLQALLDQRKFIRDIKKLVSANAYAEYFEEQAELAEEIDDRFSKVTVRSKADTDQFAKDNTDITALLMDSLEKAMLKFRSQQLKSQPGENVKKSIDLVTQIDPRLFVKMDPDEKENLRAGLDELVKIINRFQKAL